MIITSVYESQTKIITTQDSTMQMNTMPVTELDKLISTLGVGQSEDYISKARIVELIKIGSVEEMRSVIQYIDLTQFIDNTPPMHISIREGRVEMVELFLDSGSDVNQLDSDKRTPLHIAVRQQQYAIIQLLLDRGCELDKSDEFGQYALHTAIEHNDVELIQLLLCSGCDVNVQNMYGKSCLHLCIGNVTLTEVVLNAGICPTLSDHNGQHPVHIASKRGDLHSLNLLSTKHTVDVNVQDKLGRTPLHWSVVYNNLPLLQTLNDCGVDFSLKNWFGETALFTSIMFYVNGRTEQKDITIYLLEQCDQSLINVGNSKGVVPLQLIVDKADVKMAHLLLLNGANVNYRDKRSGCSSLHRAVYGCDIEMVELLLTFRPDLNLQDKEGNTVLHIAAFHGDMGVLQLLLVNGATSLHNKLGQTPLHVATARNKIDIVRTLLHTDTTPDAQDARGNTPLHYLACKTIGFTACQFKRYQI